MLITTIIIVLFSLVTLTALHELGHFLLARRFGVKVEEFGIGYPPKICGKKFGDTLYSLNLLPFGAFVRILGDEESSDNEGSFTKKPIWQRALILLGGVVSFWVVALVIIIFVAGLAGVPTAVSDDFLEAGKTPYVQILQVGPHSPAEQSGIKPGDIISKLKVQSEKLKIEETETNKVGEVQQFIGEHKGQEILISLKREDKEIEVSVTPRVNPPQGEGAMGVALARVVKFRIAWYEAPWQGLKITWEQTKNIPIAMARAIKSKLQGNDNSGLQFVGPIGLGQIMGQSMSQGPGNFLMLIAMISIWMALFNLLPIPALDGGRLLFLGIELVRRKPANQKIEQRITAVFFFLMVALMAVVSIKDIIRLF